MLRVSACAVPTAKCSTSSCVSPPTASICPHQGLCHSLAREPQDTNWWLSPLRMGEDFKPSKKAICDFKWAGTHCHPKPLLLMSAVSRLFLTYISLNAQQIYIPPLLTLHIWGLLWRFPFRLDFSKPIPFPPACPHRLYLPALIIPAALLRTSTMGMYFFQSRVLSYF